MSSHPDNTVNRCSPWSYAERIAHKGYTRYAVPFVSVRHEFVPSDKQILSAIAKTDPEPFLPKPYPFPKNHELAKNSIAKQFGLIL